MAIPRSYEIQEVAELTGLAPARLRAWERRYAVVRPRRAANRYRTYTPEQVALLRAFARLVNAGERIGELVKEPSESVIARAEGRLPDGSPLWEILDAIKRLDRDRLTAALLAERRAMDIATFTREVIAPLADAIGDLWVLRRLSVAAEHLASEVVVQLLKAELSGNSPHDPLILSACLPGERHEWGLLGQLAVFRGLGWRVQYLGMDLPLRDLIDAAWTIMPACIALSASDPGNVQARLAELRRLPRLLPPEMVVVLGGQGADAHGSRLRRFGFGVGPSGVPSPRGLRRY